MSVKAPRRDSARPLSTTVDVSLTGSRRGTAALYFRCTEGERYPASLLYRRGARHETRDTFNRTMFRNYYTGMNGRLGNRSTTAARERRTEIEHARRGTTTAYTPRRRSEFTAY
ncbi:unnamed protein product, partial [Iphiclides podalirius]